MTKSEQETRETLKKLSEINDEILKLIAHYNRLAVVVDFHNRLGLVTSNEMLEHMDYISFHVDAPDARGWFPSSFC